MRGRQRHWNIGGSQVEHRRHENQGAAGGEGCATSQKIYEFFISKWCDENDSDLRYSEVPLNGKNKTLVKILGGGRQHRTTPAGQILGRHDLCNPCGVDAYVCVCVCVDEASAEETVEFSTIPSEASVLAAFVSKSTVD